MCSCGPHSGEVSERFPHGLNDSSHPARSSCRPGPGCSGGLLSCGDPDSACVPVTEVLEPLRHRSCRLPVAPSTGRQVGSRLCWGHRCCDVLEGRLRIYSGNGRLVSPKTRLVAPCNKPQSHSDQAGPCQLRCPTVTSGKHGSNRETRPSTGLSEGGYRSYLLTALGPHTSHSMFTSPVPANNS